MKMHRDILVIEDDEDDRDILKEIFRDLGYKNNILFFSDSTEALKYIRKPEVDPFIIISDINMPKLGGLELRNIILRKKRCWQIKIYPIFLLLTLKRITLLNKPTNLLYKVSSKKVVIMENTKKK